MIKRNPTKPVRVVPPMMEEQEVSTITLQEWLDREEGCLVFINSKSKGNVSLNYISLKEYNKMWTGHLYGTLFCCRNRLFSN